MVIGSGVMTSPADSASTLAARLIRRRRSPSVKIPASAPSSPTTQVMPSRLLDISWNTSGIGVDTRTIGAASPACITCSTRIRRRPSLPPGCSDANCSSRKPLRTSSVIASASPIASAAVVLAVGTRFIGHASSAMPQSRVTSAARASVDDGSPVSAIRRAPRRRIDSSRRSSSSVSPLYDSAITTSSSRMAPRSPWIASAGCRNQADGAGARQRRRDLAADEPRLAHAGDDDAAAALVQQLRRRARRAPARRSCGRPAPGWRPPRCGGPCARARGRRACRSYDRPRARSRGSAPAGCSSGSSRSSRSAFCASLFAVSGPLVDLEEHAVDSGRDPRRRHRLDELRLPGRHAVARRPAAAGCA